MTSDPVRLGVAGLGRAFMLMVPSFDADTRVKLTAAAAPREESRDAFEKEYGGTGYATVEELCADPDVEAIYIATPHQMHVDHVLAAARAGKHILVEKPLAVSMEDAEVMVSAAKEAGVHLIVGPSHSFDPPVELATQLISSGKFGQLRMIQAFNYTDFLYRPRRPEELRTEEGGGVLFSQAIHQIDVVRRLAGGMAEKIYAMTGAWDPKRPTEGAFTALMNFAGGCVANMTYSGYAHFDSDIWMNNVGELGQRKSEGAYGGARRALLDLNPDDEVRLKTTRTFGSGTTIEAEHNEHFGPVIALCDRADLRLTPDGIEVFGDTERGFIEAKFGPAPRRTVLDALVDAVRHNKAPDQTGEWGLASLEVCHAILQSAETGQAVDLQRQCKTNH
ncbi:MULTISPECIES: Gfo/Idh/MocA family protein [Rhodobacterales]|uniref:4,5-dihydroxyphthalate dehydrogenase n=5 Tax=Rhodobacterales TaxID=204455 RepID=A0A1H6BTR9_9RHOB|nr:MULTISPECIES: Gfo/Idh/MocA family oxidoreductase [Rhodobacterales]MBA84565.1 gfo/Idh/MocA family oxidoreductase [Paracoccaceae bacterium]MBT31501.1 gfo/Idh/MocA family oxidoreductase [Thalassovita sp.]TNE80613.1 MAG: Gfo/Idh/MocA family oxidoreductase [Gammaproteobacteria bacterium]GLT12864.1 dehydrogenase [Sulfitobacter porphyrae]AUR01718.1 putative inositol 2-dehydrogenase [Phaeobacter inhibens]